MPTQSLLQSIRFEGAQDGPRFLITAGVHGDEYLPMLAVSELIRRFQFDTDLNSKLKGTLTLIPVVNEAAFRRGHRCAEDQKDLARTCPGNPVGTITEQTAHRLTTYIEKADFYIELHTGGTELAVLPLAGYTLHADQSILDCQRKMATAFHLPFLWGTSAELKGRSLSVARDANVPAIYVEYLGSHRETAEAMGFSPGKDHPLVIGCLNVMISLGILEGEALPEIEQETIEDPRPESGHMQICHPAPETGFLTTLVDLGQNVKAGQPLAQITMITGESSVTVSANEDGKVVVMRDYPRINKGDSVAVIASQA